MRVTVLASSSAANATLLQAGPDALLLDAGLKPREITRVVARHPVATGIDGVLLTHEHADHARGAAKLASLAIDIYGTAGTLGALEVTAPHRLVPVKPGRTIEINRWRAVAFRVEHDAADPVGWLVAHATEPGKVLYITDAGEIPGRFRGVTHALIEANYDPALLARARGEGDTGWTLAKRIEATHLSIDQAERLLATLDGALEETHLLHLSDRHADAAWFAERARAATSRPVYIAGHQGSHRAEAETETTA